MQLFEKPVTAYRRTWLHNPEDLELKRKHCVTGANLDKFFE